jgi:hypothetical protein
MIYYGKTLFGNGPKLTAVQNRAGQANHKVCFGPLVVIAEAVSALSASNAQSLVNTLLQGIFLDAIAHLGSSAF